MSTCRHDHKTVLHYRSGLRTIAAAIIVMMATTTLWIFTEDFLITAAFALVATGLPAGLLVIARARRRAARRRRDQAYRSRQAYIDHIESHLELDGKLEVTYRTASDHHLGQAPRIIRSPMAPGRNSHLINHITIDASDGTVIELVEKGVGSDSEELSFWRTADASALALSGNSYRALSPADIVDGDPVAVIYFPYLPALDRDAMLLRRDFQASMPTIVAAVAEFTGRNRLPNDGSSAMTRYPFPPPRPTIEELQLRMSVSAERARELLRLIDRILDQWQIVESAYAKLPRSLCHNDITAVNVAHVDNITMFIDFGKAAAGPIGSDLHTIIRNSGKAMHDSRHVEELFTTYVKAIRPHHDSTTVADVRLAAWTTFYLRYTNLKFRSAGYERPFRLALEQMNGLIEQLSVDRTV